MIHDSRLKNLNSVNLPLSAPRHKHYIVLWMQASMRVFNNHALQYAIRAANQLKLPIKAVFGLTPQYPEANTRHYLYLLEGLQDLKQNLHVRGIPLIIRLGHPPEVALHAAQDAALVVTDRGYLRHQKIWRSWLAQRLKTINTPLIQVESEALIPVASVSQKQEYAARTIRPKISTLLDEYLRPLEEHELKYPMFSLDQQEDLNIEHPQKLMATLPILQLSAGKETGGEQAALQRLEDFINQDLPHYHEQRNNPAQTRSSRLSAYLHYGHLSPLSIILEIYKHTDARDESVLTFIEELIVRRELSFNFTEYHPQYDQYTALPTWAQKTLAEHADDPRPYLYSLDQFTRAATHDPYWNAAQQEMVLTGRMHNYMRMYWGKKILEWTPSPQDAFSIMLHLNNYYQQDGGDPNSFVGVLWVLGLHDRPWKRRDIFGSVRYMNSNGLKRKFDMNAYLKQVKKMQISHHNSLNNN